MDEIYTKINAKIKDDCSFFFSYIDEKLNKSLF